MTNQDISRLVGNVSVALQSVGMVGPCFPALSRCKVPSLKVSYHRYGPPLQRYFLEVLQMPEAGSPDGSGWIRMDQVGSLPPSEFDVVR